MSFPRKKVVLASLNPGKLREFRELFQGTDFDIIPQAELAIGAASEPYPSFVENALGKARQACLLSGRPSIADDSGICVEALQGAPGIHSARFSGANASDEQNNQHLLKLLKNEKNRAAKYFCALVYLRHVNDPEPIIASGSWFGEVIDNPRGSHGFGYDPYFYLPQYQCTAAELDPTIKNKISHRALAMQELLNKMQDV
jgi:XTP/dITP diphosphohydrolase